jgi:hypothetical protein
MLSFSPGSACVVAVVLACVSLDGATTSRQQADTFERKVSQITDPRPAGAAPRRTTVTEDEVNSWFTYKGPPVMPAGIADPRVAIVGAGRVSGQAMMDFDAIGKRRASGGWLDPWALLGGRLPVVVTGTLQTSQGMGRFALESATIGGIPVPKLVIQELVGIYSRTPERPRGVSLDDPFPLPAAIRQIEVGRGEAIVVQ